MWTKRGKACLILIFSTNTNCENMAYRSFRSDKYSARGVRKVTTGINIASTVCKTSYTRRFWHHSRPPWSQFLLSGITSFCCQVFHGNLVTTSIKVQERFSTHDSWHQQLYPGHAIRALFITAWHKVMQTAYHESKDIIMWFHWLFCWTASQSDLTAFITRTSA